LGVWISVNPSAPRPRRNPAIAPARSRSTARLGAYLSTGAEGTTWPTAPGKSKQTIMPLPTAWATLKIKPPDPSVYCGYVTVAGAANDTTGIGAIATGFGLTAAPVTDWYFIIAHCDLDGSSTRDSYYFTWSGDTRIQKLNEGY
jgi:hypothetical protein